MVFYFEQINNMLTPAKDPVAQFKEHFLSKYKLVEQQQKEKPSQEQIMVEEIKEISEEQAESGNILMAGDEEDTVA